MTYQGETDVLGMILQLCEEVWDTHELFHMCQIIAINIPLPLCFLTKTFCKELAMAEANTSHCSSTPSPLLNPTPTNYLYFNTHPFIDCFHW